MQPHPNVRAQPRILFLKAIITFAAVIAFAIVGSFAGVATAGSISLLVPAYFYPGGATAADWTALDTAAQTTSVTVIFNPASGPGSITDPTWVSAISTFRADGGHVVAYVPTDYNQGGNPLTGGSNSVEGMIQGYQSLYPGLYDGFFLDEMANTPGAGNANLTYYNSIYTYIKGISGSYQVIGNMGINPTVEAFLKPATQGADTLVTYENSATTFPYATYTPPSWATNYSANHFASIIHDESTTAAMQADITRAATVNNIGYVYVTDSSGYLALPTYWNQEVAQVVAVPEPATSALLLSGGIAISLVLANRNRTAVLSGGMATAADVGRQMSVPPAGQDRCQS